MPAKGRLRADHALHGDVGTSARRAATRAMHVPAKSTDPRRTQHMTVRAHPAIVALFALALVSPATAQSLRGSPASMRLQNRVAKEHDYTFLRTAADVRRFIDLGLLVRFRGNRDYEIARVSHPYGRPALLTFVERLANQYRSACREQLVVTSLTRPRAGQPRNAHRLSVHPTGMAVDLRASRKTSCRRWLDRVLLSLEKQGVLEATEERSPPHYHVALFSKPYLRYVERVTTRSGARFAANNAGAERESARLASGPASEDDTESAADDVVEYLVHRGDTLWSIARRHDTSVEALKQLNHLNSSRIRAGDVIAVPSQNQ